MIPRIQGRVGTIEDPPELAGKFAFEIILSDIGGAGQIGDPIGPFGPFDTEAEAQRELRKACRTACEDISKKVPGGDPTKYFDMQQNKLRNWDEH